MQIIYIYICINIYIYTYVLIRVCVCIYTCTYVYLYVYTYTHFLQIRLDQLLHTGSQRMVLQGLLAEFPSFEMFSQIAILVLSVGSAVLVY